MSHQNFLISKMEPKREIFQHGLSNIISNSKLTCEIDELPSTGKLSKNALKE